MKNSKTLFFFLSLVGISSLCFGQIKPMGFTQEITTPPSDRFNCQYRPKLKLLDDMLYVCSNTGIYRKALQSDSKWELYAFEDTPIIEFVRNGDDILAISTGTKDGKDSLLLLSNDNGKTFINFTSPHFLEYKINYLSRISQNPRNDNSVFVLHVNSGLSESKDFGSNWEKLSDSNFGSQNWHLGFHPLDATTLFYSGETDFFAGMIYKSTDNGNRWAGYEHPNGDNCIHSIAFHPTNPDMLVYSGEMVMGKSVNKGETWSVTDLDDSGMYFYKVLFDENNPSNLYASGMDRKNDLNNTIQVYRSVDMGESWHLAFNEDLGAGCGGVIDMVKYKNRLIFYTRRCGLFELNLETTPPLSIQSINTKLALNIYPQPVQRTLFFETDEIITHAEITDATGRLALQASIAKNQKSIDLAFLTDGIYFAAFYTLNKEKITKKIYIKH